MHNQQGLLRKTKVERNDLGDFASTVPLCDISPLGWASGVRTYRQCCPLRRISLHGGPRRNVQPRWRPAGAPHSAVGAAEVFRLRQEWLFDKRRSGGFRCFGGLRSVTQSIGNQKR